MRTWVFIYAEPGPASWRGFAFQGRSWCLSFRCRSEDSRQGLGSSSWHGSHQFLAPAPCPAPVPGLLQKGQRTRRRSPVPARTPEKVVVLSGFRLLAVPGGLGTGNGTSRHLPSANPQTSTALPSVQPEPPSPSHQPLNLNGFGQR